VFVLLLLLLPGWSCSETDTTPDGDTPDGDATDGDEPDGDTTDGDAPDACFDADVTCGDVINGSTLTNTASRLDGYKGVDWSESGPEMVYKIPQNDDVPLVVSVKQLSATFEADYFILHDCAEPDSLVASGDEEARACLDPGVYYIVVDGRDGAKGDFQIEIACSPCDADGDEDGDEETPDGDEPDGDEPDGDEPDGDEPDGDTLIDGDVVDGDVDGDVEVSTCGCVCDDMGENCTGEPAGTTFSAEGCDGWPDATACTGFFSVYCANLCGEDTDCFMDCEESLMGDTPPTVSDGSTFSGFDCAITVHCP
jgi:hypothetical protein